MMTASRPGSETFHDNAQAALQDEQLRLALRRAMTLFAERRDKAVAGVDNWEDLRVKARRIKDETLAHLDEYLTTFAANAERAGAVVHWARDAEQANRLIHEICRQHRARVIVKSKSMTTEEIHLNAYLEQHRYEVIETDLGEYIIQLAGETPSHIIVPAIHKSKTEIAKLFNRKLGIELTEDVGLLTQTARNILRHKFACADVGITGVNFGIAETGSILILENEGNARLTASLPPIHIAVMGIEKVIPKLTDLDVFLKLLPRSGTGQALTTYQSIITGTTASRHAECAAQLHIVLLDNGRSRLLANEVTRQSLACIRCGACLNACPVYKEIGGHAYGSTYPGPIGAILTPQLIGLKRAAQLPFASSLCGACRDVCPVKIDIPELLLHLRAKIKHEPTRVSKSLEASPSSDHWAAANRVTPPFFEKLMFALFAFVMQHHRLYSTGARVGRVMQKLSQHNFVFARLGKLLTDLTPLGAWRRGREVPPLAAQSFREKWRYTEGRLEQKD